ncbi:hypothetical protein QBC38DRAFT_341117, partial [Podospora fimiseda]
VYVTEDINFTGRAENLAIELGQCLTLGNGWPNTISSFGPDQGTSSFLYENSLDNCNTNGAWDGTIQWPGIADLRSIGFNDRINSFKC